MENELIFEDTEVVRTDIGSDELYQFVVQQPSPPRISDCVRAFKAGGFRCDSKTIQRIAADSNGTLTIDPYKRLHVRRP